MNPYPCVLICHPSHIGPISCFGQDLLWFGQWNISQCDTSRGLKSTCALGLLCSAACWESCANRRLRWPDADVTQLTASSTARHVREAVPSDGCHCPRTQVDQQSCPGVPSCAANHRITSTENRCFQTLFLCALLGSDNWYRECRTIQFVCNF
jgi:hypothetical protein